MKRSILLVVLLGLTALLSSLQWGNPHRQPADAWFPAEPYRATPEDVSNPRIARLDCDHEPLGRIIQRLADSMKLNIVVDWPALAGMQLTPASPIDAHLRNMRVMAALDAIAGSYDQESRSCAISRGVIFFPGWGSPIDTETRVYDIRKLVEDYVRYDGERPAGGSIYAPFDPFRRGTEAYVEYLQEHDVNGGIQFYDELSGRLIITASREAQRHIWETLHQFRDAIPDPMGEASASPPK